MMTPSKTAFASLGLLCAFGFLAAACPAVLDDECAEGACVAVTAPGEGGADVDAAADSAKVDPCLDKPTDPACLDENKSLFVSASNGVDGDAAGTQARPFRTIGAALAKITAEKRRIYICEGTYAEDVTLDATHSGLGLFGGIDCSWKAAPASKPVIGASANPFKIAGTTGLAVADIAIEAKDATSGSSIAVFVKEGDATLRRVRLKAGKGALGDNGVLVPFTNFPSQADLNGNNAPDGTNGGPLKSYMCPGNLTTVGGKGGNIGNAGAPGTPGPANGGLVSTCTGTVDGKTGGNAASADGATGAGEVAATGWLGESGKDGATGEPGQGGGGGYGNAGAGGSGGAGGCGGAGGPGGRAGGASIALGSYLSKVVVDDSMLVAADAGNGGMGAVGQDGQTLFGFGGNRTGNACNGGAGGPGGKGGAGGGGAGGSSIGVAYKGAKPALDTSTSAAILLGMKGVGGQLVGTNAGADGAQSNELGGP